MSQKLQNFVKFQKIQLENLVDLEKCCRTHIYLQKSEPIQPKTSNVLPKFCQPTLSDVSADRQRQGHTGLRMRKRCRLRVSSTRFLAFTDFETRGVFPRLFKILQGDRMNKLVIEN